MKRFKVENVSEYKNNWGHACEQNVIYTLCGEMRKHDNGAFDKGSDYEEEHMSIKSEGFSLASASLMHTDDFEGQIKEYFERVPSKRFVYVDRDFTAYNMTAKEFNKFLHQFCGLAKESKSRGGGIKVRMRSETKACKQWLENTAKRYERQSAQDCFF